MDVSIHDNILPMSLITDVYKWAKEQSWSAPYRGVHHDFHHGKHNILTDTFAQHGIYRIGLGKTLKEVEYNCPLVLEMWSLINDNIFDNCASFEKGLPESHGSFSRKETTTGKNHYEENDFYWGGDNDLHNCYINGRGPRLVNVPVSGDEYGGLHRDSEPEFYGVPGYFTVIVAINPDWKPAYSGGVLFFDDEEVMTHKRRGYSIGWPKVVFSQKPGQICVFGSDTTHLGITPNVSAPELAMRVAFRIKLEGNGDA